MSIHRESSEGLQGKATPHFLRQLEGEFLAIIVDRLGRNNNPLIDVGELAERKGVSNARERYGFVSCTPIVTLFGGGMQRCQE
jgi:hypothetical protein